MQKIIVILCLLVTSCRLLSNAQGEINQLIVLSSPEDRIYIEPILDKYFNQIINTPEPEPIIEIKWINPWNTDEWIYSHNIMLISLEFPEDTTGDKFSKRFLNASNTDKNFFLRDDVYAKEQLFFSFNVQDVIQLQNIFNEKIDWIMEQIFLSNNNKIKSYVYSKGLNKNLMHRIKEQFGFNINIQKDFIIVDEDEDKKFLWIGRGFPYRWITIHEINKIPDIDDIFWRTYEEIISETMPQIIISDYYRTNEIVSSEDFIFSVYRGLYDHEESSSGGPFITYIVKDSETQYMYLLSGFVNYPGHKKLNLLKQIEILFQSIDFS